MGKLLLAHVVFKRLVDMLAIRSRSERCQVASLADLRKWEAFCKVSQTISSINLDEHRPSPNEVELVIGEYFRASSTVKISLFGVGMSFDDSLCEGITTWKDGSVRLFDAIAGTCPAFAPSTSLRMPPTWAW